jgi:hypothetical protein
MSIVLTWHAGATVCLLRPTNARISSAKMSAADDAILRNVDTYE